MKTKYALLALFLSTPIALASGGTSGFQLDSMHNSSGGSNLAVPGTGSNVLSDETPGHIAIGPGNTVDNNPTAGAGLYTVNVNDTFNSSFADASGEESTGLFYSTISPSADASGVGFDGIDVTILPDPTAANPFPNIVGVNGSIFTSSGNTQPIPDVAGVQGNLSLRSAIISDQGEAGEFHTTIHDSSSAANGLYGIESGITIKSDWAGSVSADMSANSSYLDFQGSGGTVTGVTAVQTVSLVATGSGTNPTGAFGIYIHTPSTAGGATITSPTGLYIGDHSASLGTPLNFHSAGATSMNQFDGYGNFAGHIAVGPSPNAPDNNPVDGTGLYSVNVNDTFNSAFADASGEESTGLFYSTISPSADASGVGFYGIDATVLPDPAAANPLPSLVGVNGAIFTPSGGTQPVPDIAGVQGNVSLRSATISDQAEAGEFQTTVHDTTTSANALYGSESVVTIKPDWVGSTGGDVAGINAALSIQGTGETIGGILAAATTQIIVRGASTNASNMYGIYIHAPITDGTGGTITGGSGIYVEDHSANSGALNIHSAGATSQNTFDGNVTVGALLQIPPSPTGVTPTCGPAQDFAVKPNTLYQFCVCQGSLGTWVIMNTSTPCVF